jgi:ligand-binding sensor domain-containing protein
MRKVTATILATFIAIAVFPQTEIPIATWRAHLSYNSIISLASSPNEFYSASDMGILIFDKKPSSVSTVNKLNGLTDAGISAIAYDEDSEQLIITYTNGNIDLLHDNTITNFSRLKELNTIPGSKQINDVFVRNQLAYLSTDYGIVVFDMRRGELKETWRDLGPNGENLKIFHITFHHDSLAAATERGVLMGNLNDNLLDYNNWKRFDEGNLALPVEGVASFNGRLYAAINTSGIYSNEGSGFVHETFLEEETFRSLQASEQNLVITTGQQIWLQNTSGDLSAIDNTFVTAPLAAQQDSSGKLWIGDSKNGLLSDYAGSLQQYLPNGPSMAQVFRLSFAKNRIWAVNGGFTGSGQPLNQSGKIDYFENGLWVNYFTNLQDVTDVQFNANILFIASFGDGLVGEMGDGNIIRYDNTNSQLQCAGAGEHCVYISDMVSTQEGLWILNYGVEPPLYLVKDAYGWETYTPSFTGASYCTKMAVDLSGKVWMAVNPALGGGLIVFDPSTLQSTLRNDVAGSGGLLNKNVRSMAVDRDGNIWVGTDAGIGYFFSENEDAVIPIFENRFLLKDEKITALAVDGGNRKWIGTEHGLWVVNPTGESLVYNFTAENSPLFSNNILDIEINPTTGEVFIATDKGLISYRADATRAEQDFSAIKIFPNPVASDFAGMVGISGLQEDAMVKITDVSGKVIWQTRAQGGTATWNVRDYNGVHARTGIYLVFAASQNGSESVVGKIAVVE